MLDFLVIALAFFDSRGLFLDGLVLGFGGGFDFFFFEIVVDGGFAVTVFCGLGGGFVAIILIERKN